MAISFNFDAINGFQLYILYMIYFDLKNDLSF